MARITFRLGKGRREAYFLYLANPFRFCNFPLSREAGKKLGVDQEGTNIVREFLMARFWAKWTAKIERIDEAGNLQPSATSSVPN